MNSCVGPTEEDLDIDGRFNEARQESQNGSFSSSAMTSSASASDLSWNKSAGEENSGDLLERVSFRTSQEDSKTSLIFVSSVFFNMFLSIIKFKQCKRQSKWRTIIE